MPTEQALPMPSTPVRRRMISGWMRLPAGQVSVAGTGTRLAISGSLNTSATATGGAHATLRSGGIGFGGFARIEADNGGAISTGLMGLINADASGTGGDGAFGTGGDGRGGTARLVANAGAVTMRMSRHNCLRHRHRG